MTPEDFAPVIADLINNGSIELCDPGDAIPTLPEVLPFQKSVFVPATKKRPLPLLVATLEKLRHSGFDPVPHIAARRLTSQKEIESFLKKAVESCGVHRVLLIGGDISAPAGPYASALDLLKSGVLQDAGIREVAFAGYPDGHPFIPQDEIDQALLDKLAYARETGLGASIITQFSFTPKHIVDYCAHMARTAADIPVYVGIPGPCDPIKLFKYAKICGVTASTKILGDIGFKAIKLVTSSDPGEQLAIVAKGVVTRNLSNVVGAHIFSFGDIAHSARWLAEQLRGEAPEKTEKG